jgi:hypothetical protein
MQMKIKNIKQFNRLRALFGVVAIIMVFTAVNINLAYAQDSVTTDPTPTPTTSPVPDPTPFKRKIKYTPAQRKELKDQIMGLLIAAEVASDAVTPDTNSKKRITAAKTKLDAFTEEELDVLRDSIDPAEIASEVEDAKGKVEKFKPGAQAAYAEGDSAAWRAASDNDLSGDFAQSLLPGIAPPDAVCLKLVGSGKAKLEVVAAATAVYVAAKILDIAFNRGCNQVVVAGVIVLGAGGVGGGNTSLACVVTDGLLFAAEQVLNKVHSCDVDFTERSVDAAVARMETVHGDIANSVTNDNTNTTSILNNDNANKTTITTAVTSAKDFIDGNATTNKNTIIADALANKNIITSAINTGTTTVTTAVGDGTTTILVNDNKNKNTIVDNDNTNKNTVVKNDNDNKDTIIANDNANKIEVIRLKIAVDLSSTDGSVLVGAFMLPSAKGGYLELVRTVLVEAITNLAGSSTSQANSLLAQGDASKNAGDYKNAYSSYRKAYKVAVK